MRKKRKYYDFYIKCMETGKIPFVDTGDTEGGLCSIFPKKMDIFKPSHDDVKRYDMLFGGEVYWGSDHFENSYNAATEFSTLRQTIVLFFAAMNNEL